MFLVVDTPRGIRLGHLDYVSHRFGLSRIMSLGFLFFLIDIFSLLSRITSL